MNFHLIILLVATFMTAPVVDALACDECRGAIPICNTQRSAMTAGQSDEAVLVQDARGPLQQDTVTPQDLCPFCSHSITATVPQSCGAPSTISLTHQLPQLLGLSALSKSITKPPQN